MTRIKGETQTRVGHPRGDCYRACVATVLGLPIAAVPDIHYDLDTWPALGDEPNAEQLAETIRVTARWRAWFADRGLLPLRLRGLQFSEGDGVVTIGTVLSPSGPWHHAVVCVDGVVAWDPNPTGLSYGLEPLDHELLALRDPRRTML